VTLVATQNIVSQGICAGITMEIFFLFFK